MEYPPPPSSSHGALDTPSVETAFALFRRGDAAAAEDILIRLPGDASALHLLGVLRVRQQRLPEAAGLLAQSVALRPGQAQAHLNLGKVLATLGQHGQATEQLQQALSCDAALPDAHLALAKSRQALGDFAPAIASYRTFLATHPHHRVAILGLAETHRMAGSAEEAEAVLLAALAAAIDKALAADIHEMLAQMHRATEPARALVHVDTALRLDPSRTKLNQVRPALLEDLQQYDEARDAYKHLLSRDPADAGLHRDYNDLLYRLGDAEFLASYDHVPRMKELVADKANFLLSAGRAEEARQCFQAVATRYGEDKSTLLGIGLSMLKAGAFSSAVDTFRDGLARFGDSAELYCNLAGALCRLGDPRQAQEAAAKALAGDPQNQLALAMMGTCWRLREDARDEALNGYEEFIRVFDIEPPEGFPDIASFNAELLTMLKAWHPPTREYLRQSLRGGSQTRDRLFDRRNALLAKLQARLRQAIRRYIGGLRKDADHPLLSRATDGFRFAGSWSSQLRDTGFHINHLHPGGWISSCYYVDLPPVIGDRKERQGWIKFGEPSFEVGLAARRVIQPVAGQLILFPSYMWHGTIPFHDRHPRTTIAFDARPA